MQRHYRTPSVYPDHQCRQSHLTDWENPIDWQLGWPSQVASKRIGRGLGATGVGAVVLLAIGVVGVVVIGSHRPPAPLTVSSPPALRASGAAGGHSPRAGGRE